MNCLFISEAIIIYTEEEWALKLEARKNPGGEEAYVKELLDSRKEDANKSVLHYFDANNDIDPIHALIPYGTIELKVPNAGCRNQQVLANYEDQLKKVKDLALEASKKADEKVTKHNKRNESTFRKNHGYSQELADTWKHEPISNKRRRVKEEGIELKIKAFLTSCAKESEGESAPAEVLQWQDRYIDNDNASYYLLNALDRAVQQGNGDYTTLLSNAVSQHDMKGFLLSIHAAFADNVYDFVHSGEHEDAFVCRFTMNKFVFSQHFATYFVDKIISHSKPPTALSSLSSTISLTSCASSSL